jgi:hypothetical protein
MHDNHLHLNYDSSSVLNSLLQANDIDLQRLLRGIYESALKSVT